MEAEKQRVVRREAHSRRGAVRVVLGRCRWSACEASLDLMLDEAWYFSRALSAAEKK